MRSEREAILSVIRPGAYGCFVPCWVWLSWQPSAFVHVINVRQLRQSADGLTDDFIFSSQGKH